MPKAFEVSHALGMSLLLVSMPSPFSTAYSYLDFVAQLAARHGFLVLLSLALLVFWVLLLQQIEGGLRAESRVALESGGHSSLSPATFYLLTLFALGALAVVSAIIKGKQHWGWECLLIGFLIAAIMLYSSGRVAWLILFHSSPMGLRYHWGGFGGGLQGIELSTALTHLLVAASFGMLLTAAWAVEVKDPPSPPLSSTETPTPSATPSASQTASPTHTPANSPTAEPTPTTPQPVHSPSTVTPTPPGFLGSVYFNPRTPCPPRDSSDLERVAKRVREDNEACVYVCGHADSAGDEAGNALLALQRADCVNDRLAREAPGRLDVCSRGERSAHPTPQDEDRRVDVYLLPPRSCRGE